MSKKSVSRTVSVESESEALVVQHALAFYRDMKRHATNAPLAAMKGSMHLTATQREQ